MKKEEHQFKLAKIAIKRFFTVLVLLASFMDGVPAQSNKTRDINKPEGTEH